MSVVFQPIILFKKYQTIKKNQFLQQKNCKKIVKLIMHEYLMMYMENGHENCLIRTLKEKG